MLSDEDTYEKVKKDPTQSLQRKMNEILLSIKKKGHLDPIVYNKVKCSSELIPRLYGNPKVHKIGQPLRPIVSIPSVFTHIANHRESYIQT